MVREKGKIATIIVDYVKNEDNQIIAINSSKNMSRKFDSVSDAKEYIKNVKHINHIITDINGFGMDSIYISRNISKRDKSILFNNYSDAYDSMVKTMTLRPAKPIAGSVFEQDMNTSEYFFYFENINSATFALLFGVDAVLKDNGSQMLQYMEY